MSEEAVNDRAKLLLHRLIARRLAREPGLIEAARHAKIANMCLSATYPAGRLKIRDWLRRELLSRTHFS